MVQVTDVFDPMRNVNMPMGPGTRPLPTQTGSAGPAHRSVTQYSWGNLAGIGDGDTLVDKVLPPVIAGLILAVLLRSRKRR